MDEESYTTLVNLLKAKKNIILQGAPGVGKTFVAKRLAYSIIGERDTSRVCVQFIRVTAMKFIMGIVIKDGFELPRPFISFAKLHRMMTNGSNFLSLMK